MNILFLSYYFHPDLSAGSFRSKALVDSLIEKGGPNLQVTVISTRPNRYGSYDGPLKHSTLSDQLEIIRIQVPDHEGRITGQIKGFILYYFAVIRLAKQKKYDLVFATSSRLMTAFLGARVSKALKVSLYLDIRDIFPDTIKYLFSNMIGCVAKLIFSYVEKWTIKSAARINLVSSGFRDYFYNISQDLSISFYTNGIDDEFIGIQGDSNLDSRTSEQKIVLYAGNIGFGQGLHLILPELAKKTLGSFKYRVIGDGGMLADLKINILKLGISNIEIINPMPRERLITEYLNADVLMLHLNKLPAFEKVLPSKIFEYASFNKPILAGVSGYPAQFLRDEVSDGVVIFDPCDVGAAVEGLNSLNLMSTPRPNFIKKYKRSEIMKLMALDVISLVGR